MRCDNTPMHYTAILMAVKTTISVDCFLLFAQNIDRRYTLGLPQNNEYPQSLFLSNHKKTCRPLKTTMYYSKIGVRVSSLHGHVSMKWVALNKTALKS